MLLESAAARGILRFVRRRVLIWVLVAIFVSFCILEYTCELLPDWSSARPGSRTLQGLTRLARWSAAEPLAEVWLARVLNMSISPPN